MSAPRFIVTPLTGGRIAPRVDEQSGGHQVTSFYLQDTLYLYRVLATYDNSGGQHRSLAALRRRADAACAALNAWWDEECARG